MTKHCPSLSQNITAEFSERATSLVLDAANKDKVATPDTNGEGVARASQNCILAMRENWAWISKLVKCTDIHLKNTADYHEVGSAPVLYTTHTVIYTTHIIIYTTHTVNILGCVPFFHRGINIILFIGILYSFSLLNYIFNLCILFILLNNPTKSQLAYSYIYFP